MTEHLYNNNKSKNFKKMWETGGLKLWNFEDRYVDVYQFHMNRCSLFQDESNRDKIYMDEHSENI